MRPRFENADVRHALQLSRNSMLDDEHFTTKSDLAEAQQCLESYEAAGLYREALENQRPCAGDRSIEGTSSSLAL